MSAGRKPWLRRGRVVVFLGLDGAGKSTLIERVTEAVEKRGIPVTSKHMHPGFLPPLARVAGKKPEGPVTDPHAKAPSGTLVSLLRFGYYWLDYVAGYWFSAFPRTLLRREVLLFDRYAYDYLIDPVRCRVTLPQTLRRLFIALVPRPDLVVIPFAEPEVLFARKPEVPLEELRLQADRMTSLFSGSELAQFVDTAQSVEASCAEALDAVLDVLGEKRADPKAAGELR